MKTTSKVLLPFETIETLCRSQKLIYVKEQNACEVFFYIFFAFRDKLFINMRLWLENVFSISLENTVDMSCAQYKYTGDSVYL